jgi:hypothetical protein
MRASGTERRASGLDGWGFFRCRFFSDAAEHDFFHKLRDKLALRRHIP